MGIHELEIALDKALHKVCVIKGDNGAGKSTLFNAMHPFNDPSKEFIPNLSAEKIISYDLGNQDQILMVKYLSAVDDRGNRKSTTCHVIKRSMKTLAEMDLNPNGNINEGKARICEELDIDTGIMVLGQLSSENRGLVDMTPSERKLFINDKIDELEAYNIIYKKLNKKSITLKTMVGSLSTKIDSIGNVEQIQNTINSLETTLGQFEDRKVMLIAGISSNKEKLNNLDKDGNIIQNYTRAKNELSDISCILDNKKNILETIIPEDYESKMNLILSKLESKQENLTEKIGDLDSRKTDMAKSIQSKQITLSSIGDLELYDVIQSRVSALEQELEEFIVFFKNIGFKNYDIVSEGEYETALEYIDRINSIIDLIKHNYSYETIQFAFQNMQSYTTIFTVDKLNSLKDTLNKTNIILTEQNTLKQSCSDFDLIPEKCNCKEDCPFIRNIVSAKKNLLPSSDYSNILSSISSIEKDIEEYEKEMSDEEVIKNAIRDVNNLMSNIPYGILSKFPGTKWLENKDSICNKVLNGGSIELDCKAYLEHKNLITLIKSHKADIDNLKEQLSGMSKNKAMIKMLADDISKLRIDYNSLESAKQSLTSEWMILSDKVDTLKRNIDATMKIKQEKDMLLDMVEKKEKLIELVSQLDSDYKAAALLNESINKDIIELKELNINTIGKIQDEINSYKYKIVLYNDYTKEYSEYSKEYSKIEKIKFYASPTKGIQTVLMEMYMNGIISVSNDLLKMFFGGEYVLHPFIINEKEFRMPCLGKGLINDDISSMSTSQRCMISMIISFALLRQASESFGIAKIDEIDGGLDSANRAKFSPVLNSLMDVLHYQQCIMISHNAELGMHDADIIVLKNTDPDLNLDGNIIFDINKGIA